MGRRGIVALGIAVLAAVVALVVVATGRDGDAGEATGPLARQPARPASDPFAEDRQGDEPPPAAGSPEEAATSFLDAEVAADAEAAFPLLAAEDREEHGSPAGWEEARSELWQPTGFELTGIEDASRDAATALADVTFEPAVDPYLGVVPERALLTMPLVREDGAWRIAFLDSGYEPEYPDDDGAADAVRRWAESHQACAPEGEWEDGLLDSPYLAESLCRAQGNVAVGRVDTLDALTDATPYLNEFGEAAADWARVVPVEGPVELDAVAAPLGDRWIVLGASPP